MGPFHISPLPKAPPQERKASGRAGKTAIMTSSPFKSELLASLNKTTNKTMKRKPAGKTEEKTCGKKVIKKNNKTQASEHDSDDDECIYCGESYSNEGWIQCQECNKWAHNSCAGVDKNRMHLYVTCVLINSVTIF